MRRRVWSLPIAMVFVWSVLLLITVVSFSQEETSGARPVDAAKRSAIIEAVVQKLNEFYIDPDVAKQMEEYLRKGLSEGRYDRFTQLNPFVRQLTDDLYTVSHDHHLGVWPIEMALLTENSSEEDRKRLTAVARYNNYGFNKVERLPGNIGYLDLSYFEELQLGGDTTVAAMNFLANSDALIIDVRRNGGGSDVLDLVWSYLFKEPVHTMDNYSRISKTTDQRWTMAYVPGPRLDKIPVYVLISRRTASAAEALAYVMKTQGRGTLVGEVSRGAANPIEEFTVPELSICMAVSAYRVSSPITGTCWEGVGVEPDIKVPPEKALYAAGVEAMKKLLESEAYKEITQARQWALEMYQAELNPVTLRDEDLAGFTGEYGPIYSVAASGGQLTLINKYKMPIALIPLGNDQFALKEEEGKVNFVRGASGAVSEMVVMYADGYQSSNKKTSDQ
jgi:hypothetical protein